jgi:hypothetical protein
MTSSEPSYSDIKNKSKHSPAKVGNTELTQICVKNQRLHNLLNFFFKVNSQFSSFVQYNLLHKLSVRPIFHVTLPKNKLFLQVLLSCKAISRGDPIWVRI